jgi:hypothetical protein
VGNMPHRLGSEEYISQGTWRNSLVFLDYGKSNPYISLPERMGYYAHALRV